MPPARILFYLATAGGVALAVHALVVEPPPLWVAIVALFAYVGLVTLGVVFARFSMFADVVTLGPRNARGVALTFDDGPDPVSTLAILDLLDEAGAKATFFVIGHKADAHPEVIRQIVERGHAIGVHGYSHDRLFMFRPPWRVRKELDQVVDRVQEITGERPWLFRPPIGHISPSIAQVIRKMELQAIGWSARGVDGWSGATSEAVARRVIRRLKDGAIIMLHDAAERGDFVPASVGALPAILAAAEQQHLSFVRVDSWLGAGSEQAQQDAHDG
ncbi:MAG: polysaccharide deacetylase family protein [Deltaproteobacteria bacterium]|nr:MAG: polysaccharide deacetylase family protein [Deltaproteobacteria bacterium]